jgi:diphosphomevalonate decarboxylase
MAKCKSGVVSWRSPSNIAFVKYWGKTGRQLPMNPSLSMTLKHSYTDMKIRFHLMDTTQSNIISKFTLEGEENKKFQLRLENFLQSIIDICPFVAKLQLEIESSNSFPHSVGIASSASGLSALALGITSIEAMIEGRNNVSMQKASLLSRLGSGSACRSVYPGFCIWGNDLELDSSDEFAVEFRPSVVFNDLKDTILIIDSTPKKVSSSIGHDKMNGHPFAQARFKQARQHIHQLADAMRSGDWDTFGELLELEALTLHALMMSSSPSFVLLKPASLGVIEKIRAFRGQTGAKVYFTIDAGPNIHLIYPASEQAKLEPLFSDLETLCESHKMIHDELGPGPVLLERSDLSLKNRE